MQITKMKRVIDKRTGKREFSCWQCNNERKNF